MLKPRDEADLAETVASAKTPLAIIGGGTRTTGRTIEGTPVTVSDLGGITLYDPGALTMVALAGTPLADIEQALNAEGQMLAFEPPDLSGVTGWDGVSTIGGVFATNASGARRIQGGAARDYLLGVRFVDGQGTVIKSGGRVMKNVTGYDLVKLMAGSHGTLGVLSEVSFKVLPKSEAVQSVILTGLSDTDAVRAMSSALTSPFDVSGAFHAPSTIKDVATTMIRIEGFAESVKYRAGQLVERLCAFGDIDCRAGAECWDALRNRTSMSEAVRGEFGAVWAVSVKPSDAPGFIAPLADQFGCLHEFDWAGGRINVWLSDSEDCVGLHKAMQSAAAQSGGHARLVNGQTQLADAVPVFQPEAAPLVRLAEGLRKQFDPRGILNPGLMG